MKPGSSILSDVRVVDLSRNAPGPYCTMLLADLGADVVVVGGGRSGLPVDALCRGKTFITLDLKSNEGRDALHRLAAEADVLVEGFRPGVADRLGAGYDELSSLNPGLIHCSVTGYGPRGPLAQTVGHDINYLAVAGVLGAVGPAGSPPVPPLNLLADFGGGGLLAAFGIVAALHERSRSGRGQHIDASMVDGAVSMMAMHYADWGTETLPARGQGLLTGEAPFYRCYECADGRYVAVGALEDAFFAELWAGLDLGDPPAHLDRGAWPGIERALTDTFKTRPRDYWVDLLRGREACVSPVLEPDEVNLPGPGRQVPPVPAFSRTPGTARPTDLADDTEQVLRKLGIERAELAAAKGAPPDVRGLRWPPV